MISDLQCWLDIVTGVFPHETATRLRRELETHAEETAQMLQAEGHSNPEAAALHALGDAREVRRRLEETHFTRAEVEWLRQDAAMRRVLEEGFYPDVWWRSINLMGALFLLMTPLMDLKSVGTFSWTHALICWGLASAILLIQRLVIPRFSRVAAAILWRVLGVLSVPFWMVLTRFFFAYPREDWDSVLFPALVVCVVLYFLWPQAAFALLPKALRRAA